MTFEPQNTNGNEIHDAPSNPPDISVSLTSPYVSVGLNATLLVNSFDSLGSGSWSNFGVFSIAHNSDCEAHGIKNFPPTMHFSTKSPCFTKGIAPVIADDEHAPLSVTIMEGVDKTEAMSKAASKIQAWWRRVLQRRRLEKAALRYLFLAEKKRIIKRSSSINQGSLVKTRVFRSPRVATRIMKRMRDSEPFVRNSATTHVPSPVPTRTECNVPVSVNKPPTSTNENEGITTRDPTEFSVKSTDSNPEAADIVSEILSTLEKLGSLESELVVRNERQSSKSLDCSQTLHAITEMLMEVHSVPVKNNEGEDVTVGSKLFLDKRITANQMTESLKALSDIETIAKENSFQTVIKSNEKGDSHSRRPTLTPTEVFPFSQGEEACVVSGAETVELAEIRIKTPNLDNQTMGLNGSFDTSTFSDVTSKDNADWRAAASGYQLKRQVAEPKCALQKQKAVAIENGLRDCEKRLRDEYEEKLGKNYRLVDELLAEKKALTEQCDRLVADMRQISEKALAKQKLMEENYKVELKKAEAKAAAAEKVKRERWEAAKTKSIKEMAMKSVEHEVQRLMQNHKEEVEELKRQFKEEVEAADTRAFECYSTKLEELRSRFDKEREEACLKERKLVSERYTALMVEERQVWEDMRKKWLKEVSEENNRLMSSLSRERADFEEQIRRLNGALADANQTHLLEVTRIKKDLEADHVSELAKLQSRMEAEKVTVEETVRAQMRSEFLEREREIVDRLRKERDRQLEAAVQRLEEEVSLSREETECSAQEKIRRLKEKYQKSIDELEAAEQQANDKYNQMRARCLELEGELNCYKVRLAQAEEEAGRVQSTNERLTREREHVREAVARDVAEEMAAAKAQASRAQRELAETRAQANAEVARLQEDLASARRDAAEKLESIHQRIKEAIVKKDENTKELVRKYEKKIRELTAQLANGKGAGSVDDEDHDGLRRTPANGIGRGAAGVARAASARMRVLAVRKR